MGQAKSDGVSWKGSLSAAAMLASGTAVAVLTKIAYETESLGIDGTIHHFEKPWALTSTMFLGMSLCLPIAYWQKYSDGRAKEAAAAAADEGEAAPRRSPLQLVFDGDEARDAAVLAAPALLDLCASALTYFGLVSVTASVFQMLRGAMLVFAALFGVTLLRRQLNRDHLAGISATLAGVLVVGAASLLSGEGSAVRDVPQAEMVVGLAACVIGQAMQALQVTAEEYLMSSRSIEPAKVVGYEGVWGAAAVLGVLLPLMQVTLEGHGVPGDGANPWARLHEDSADTLVMLANNPTLAALLAADLLAFSALNLSGMAIIAELGAVYKSVLEAARTLTVWLVGLGLYYSQFGGGVGGFGEAWGDYSWAQLLGFGVLVTGTRLYSRGNAAAASASASAPAASSAAEDGDAQLLLTRPLLAAAADAGEQPQQREHDIQQQQQHGEGKHPGAAAAGAADDVLASLASSQGGSSGGRGHTLGRSPSSSSSPSAAVAAASAFGDLQQQQGRSFAPPQQPQQRQPGMAMRATRQPPSASASAQRALCARPRPAPRFFQRPMQPRAFAATAGSVARAGAATAVRW